MREATAARLGRIHEEMHLWVDAFLERRGVSWRAMEAGHAWGSRELPFESLERLVEYLVYSDPVAFVECMFRERTKRGHPPWRLFGYQRVSMRTPGNTVHQCGAEVGKSREISGLTVWAAVTGRGEALPGEILIAAARDKHLEDIYKEIRWQLETNPWLWSQFDDKASRKKPERLLAFSNGNLVHMQTAGHDGTGLRSSHIQLILFGDEWAKVANPETQGNFDSRAEPGCWTRIYSTPDGNRSAPYYEICERTPVVDPLAGPGPERAPTETVRFIWPKPLMPAPYWTPERERYYVQRYGGRHSQRYQQNVLGNHGDPAAAVFPWPVVVPCLHYLPEYRSLRLAMDNADGRLELEVAQLSRGYHLGARLGDECAREVEPPTTTVRTQCFDVGGWDPRAALRPILAGLAEAFDPKELVVGADLGTVNDPTEVWVGRCRGGAVRWLCRLSLIACTYPLQNRILRAVDAVLRPGLGWGVDATGQGLTMAQLLTDPEQGPPLEVSGYVMNRVVPDTDPLTGEPRLDPQGRPIQVRLLERSVQLLELAIQRLETELPYDPDLMLEFQGLTSRITPSGARAFQGEDHILTALGCALLRREEALGTGHHVPVRIHVPHGSSKRLRTCLDF